VSTPFNLSDVEHVTLDEMSIKDERQVVASGENRCDEKRSGDSLDCLDLFNSLPISEQGWGREVVDYE
jgi:hypothetical protein